MGFDPIVIYVSTFDFTHLRLWLTLLMSLVWSTHFDSKTYLCVYLINKIQLQIKTTNKLHVNLKGILFVCCEHDVGSSIVLQDIISGCQRQKLVLYL